MCKRLWPFTSMAVLICGASLCKGAALPNTPPTKLLPPAVNVPPALVQRLRAPIPRQTLLNALLAGANTKSATADGIAGQGASKHQIDAVADRVATPKLRAEAVPPPGDADFKNLDWKAGFTFTPFAVPKYGSGNWRLGTFSINHATLRTEMPDVVMFNTMDGLVGLPPISLIVEIPPEPGLYIFTMRLVRTDGLCAASWVAPGGPGIPAPITASLQRVPDTNTNSSPVTQIPLTVLPDGTGVVGLLSTPSSRCLDGSQYGMRTVTSIIDVVLYPPNFFTTSDYMGTLIFGGITITRL